MTREASKDGIGLRSARMGKREPKTPFVTRSFLLLVARPGAPNSVLAPSSEALCY